MAGVEVGVVPAAEQDEVCQGCRAAVYPGDQMVCVAHDWGCCADDAAAVAGVQGAADGFGDEAFAAADVEGFGL
ncbi:hypothetical protein GCM10010530_07830 [Kribbella aluminosa]